MRLVQYLIEASRGTADAYNQFQQDYQATIGDTPPSARQLTGILNRRAHKAGTDERLDFITDWFLKRGFLQQKGSMVVPTARGSELRQSLVAAPSPSDDGLSNASAKGFKALRKYFMDVTDENVREYLSTLDEPTLQAVATARELEQDDISILNGIRDRAENHRERASYVQAMKEKNPDRLARLESLGFIDTKTGGFNKGAWDKFVGTINALDPARIKTLIPGFYQWATHSAGNTAKNVNRILFAIHPNSRNRTEKGRHVWDMLKNLDDATLSQLQRGKKPAQGNLSDEAYQLLITAVASIVRTFPDVTNAEELIQTLDDSFDSRVDFKSLDRSADKTSARRQGVRDTLRQF